MSSLCLLATLDEINLSFSTKKKYVFLTTVTRIYKKYGWIIVFTGLIVWTILTPSHFQKGGVSYDFYYIIALFVTAISVLINLFFDDFHWVEKILVSLPFAFISLFLTTLIICPIIVNLFYGDKTWFLWESNHRLFINGIFYGLNTALLTLFSHLYFNIRGKMKGGRRINESLD